jgi:hypothetical protein
MWFAAFWIVADGQIRHEDGLIKTSLADTRAVKVKP